MQYHLNSRQEIEDFIRNEVLTTSEVVEILGVTRQRVSQMIAGGKLNPIKKLRGDSLFLRSDIEEKKKELEALRKKYRPYDME
ncbi:UNVERIFIED_ORG: AlpA family transcriptional regulator [Anoxybacillus amylolyticus]|uniref:helix-turn-helix domain-containing protein n=1 Tax=Geobacillus TaxID=129337 RepID=UPI00093F9F88|nr:MULTISPECIES: helix-turn-helix domain-containing protein [Geobacillus]OPW98373.1 DNA-binding protein [Geobacillus sp. LEMMY01]